MKKYYLFILAVFITITSCRKENIGFEEGERIDTPIEIEGAYYEGKIVSNGEVVSGATINIYQSGEKIGETTSDANGNYSTIAYKLKIGPKVTFEVNGQDYIRKLKREESQQGTYTDFDISIYKKGSQLLLGTGIENPADTTLVKIYGTFTDKYGEPIVGVLCNPMWNIVEVIPGASYTLSAGWEYTDENGYFECLVEANQYMYFKSAFYATDCVTVINEIEVSSELFILDEAQDIGPLTDDFEVIEQESLELDFFYSKLKANMYNCDGTPMTNGEVVITTDYDYGGSIIGGFTITTWPDENGYWEQDFDFCDTDIDLNIVITFKDDQGFAYSETLHVEPGTKDFGNIVACEENNTNYSTISLYIGTEFSNPEIQFFQVPSEDGVELQLAGVPEFFSGFASIKMEELAIGVIPIDHFSFSTDSAYGFDSDAGELTAEIYEINEGQAIGSYSGTVTTTGLGSQSVSGEFTFNYE